MVNNTNGICPTDSDLEDREFVLSYYQQYLNAYDETSLKAQADTEVNDRSLQVFGTTDIPTILNIIENNPLIIADGQWGFSHAVIALLSIDSIWNTTGDIQQVNNEILYQRAYWFTRESIARCNDSIDKFNPLLWNEDSRLDYWTVIVFTNWYLNQI